MAYQVKAKNKSLLKLRSQNFQYQGKTFWKTFFHFLVVKKMSKRYLQELSRFLQTYPRAGVIQGKNKAVKVNTLEHYWEDSERRGLKKIGFVYSENELKRIQEVEIFNAQKEKISALILTQPEASKWVIGLHGWTENKYLALRQTYLYTQLGYNILTFDAKGHGASYGHFNDVGYSTPEDLKAVLQWLEKNQNLESYGVVGNSMGGASALKFALAVGSDNPDLKLKFVVDDAGFNNLLIELRYILEANFKKPWWKIGYQLKRHFTRELKINFQEYDLLKKISQIPTIPVLFLHGIDDDLVPVFHSKELYQAKIQSEKEPKSEILTLGGVKHVQMISQANPLYVATIKKFLTNIEEISPGK